VKGAGGEGRRRGRKRSARGQDREYRCLLGLAESADPHSAPGYAYAMTQISWVLYAYCNTMVPVGEYPVPSVSGYRK
jgi:hypothetical protein